MKNRNASGPAKRAEKSVQIPWRRPFHLIPKQQKQMHQIIPTRRGSH